MGKPDDAEPTAAGESGAEAFGTDSFSPRPSPAAWPPSPTPRTRRPERVVMSPRDAFSEGQEETSPTGRLRARPYVLTKGRTRARSDLAVETLVSAEPQARWHLHKPGTEYRKLGQLCSAPVSVAEIAANLSVPLGVARVLISDLADTGYVRVHLPAPTKGGRPDRVLLDRVLAGLRNL